MSKTKIIKVMPPAGKPISKKLDKKRKALKCGVRISREGKKYTERRVSRCDEDLRRRI